MNKEELNSKITEALGSTQITLSERTRNDFLDGFIGLMPENTELNEGVVAKAVSMLKSMDGNLHSDVSAEVKKYKDEHPVTPPKPQEQNNPNANESEMEKKFKELSDKLEALENKRKGEEAEKTRKETIEKVKSSLIEKNKKAGIETNNFILATAIRDLDVKEGASVDSLVADVEKVYNQNLKEAGLDGVATPRFGGGSGEKGKTALDNFFKNKGSREGWKK